MKLLDLTCPKCGAELKVNEELDRCVCNYCGHEILIDKEEHKVKLTGGYEFGYGSTMGKLQAEYDFKQEHPTEEQKYLEQQIQQYNREVKINSAKRAWHYATIGCAIGFFGGLLYWSQFSAGLLVGFISLILVFVVAYKVQTKLYLKRQTEGKE